MHINTSGNNQTILFIQLAHIFAKVIESLSCKQKLKLKLKLSFMHHSHLIKIAHYKAMCYCETMKHTICS